VLRAVMRTAWDDSRKRERDLGVQFSCSSLQVGPTEADGRIDGAGYSAITNCQPSARATVMR
jgi:hypothetical protein